MKCSARRLLREFQLNLSHFIYIIPHPDYNFQRVECSVSSLVLHSYRFFLFCRIEQEPSPTFHRTLLFFQENYQHLYSSIKLYTQLNILISRFVKSSAELINTNFYGRWGQGWCHCLARKNLLTGILWFFCENSPGSKFYSPQ